MYDKIEFAPANESFASDAGSVWRLASNKPAKEIGKEKNDQVKPALRLLVEHWQ